MIAPATAEIAVHDPKWVVMDFPFMFNDEAMFGQVFEGKAGRLLFESLDKRGYKGLSFWNNGFKQMTNNIRPIIHPEDVNGLKIRIMPSNVLKESYEMLGAIPTVHPFNEVYSVLNNGTVDGTENTLSNIYSKGFHRKQKYMTISNHNYLGYVVLVNPEFWASLPINYQTAIEEAMAEATIWIRNNAESLNNEMLKKIEESGMEMHYQTAEEKKIWREALCPIYDLYEPIIGNEIMTEIRRLQNDGGPLSSNGRTSPDDKLREQKDLNDQ